MLKLSTQELRELVGIVGQPPIDGNRAQWRAFERRLLKALGKLKGRAFAERARFEGVDLTTPCDHHLMPDEFERGGP